MSFEGLKNEHQEQVTEIEGLLGFLEEQTRPVLQELRAGVTTSTMMEYSPTGQTPQKREWNYPTDLPRTENQESIIAKRRGLPDPALSSKTPSTARTPGRSPWKQMSPRKGHGSPSKLPSPKKTKIFTDVEVPPTSQPCEPPPKPTTTTTVPVEQAKSGLKEIDINVAGRPTASISASTEERERPVLLDFSKSLGSAAGPPPLKRHATTNAVVESKLPTKLGRNRSTVAGIGMGVSAVGVESFSQSVGGGRRLRSSPPE